MYVCAYVCVYVHMYVCMFVCTHVCMYVCMYAYIYACHLHVCTRVKKLKDAYKMKIHSREQF